MGASGCTHPALLGRRSSPKSCRCRNSNGERQSPGSVSRSDSQEGSGEDPESLRISEIKIALTFDGPRIEDAARAVHDAFQLDKEPAK
jgi:hypothetical protein